MEKFFDVKRVHKSAAKKPDQKFWADQRPAKTSSSSIWIYGILFTLAFILSLVTTALVANRTNPGAKTPSSSPVSYTPQTKPGEKNPFDDQQPPTTNPQPDALAAAQPTVSNPIDRKAIRLRILNGNGIAGEAAKMKSQLEEGGFSVSSIGNAKFSYTQTQIYYVANKKTEAESIASAITNYDTVITEAATSVVGDNTDVLVVVGKK